MEGTLLEVIYGRGESAISSRQPEKSHCFSVFLYNSVSFIKANVVLTFLSTLETESQFLAKQVLKQQRLNQASEEEDTNRSAPKWIWRGGVYQEVNDVKILKRSAKAESMHAQRAELGLQECCTWSRIRSRGCMKLLQTEIMKNVTVLNTDPVSDWEVCHLLQKLITFHYLFFINWCGILLSQEWLAS